MTQHLMFTHELILDWRRLTPGEAGDRQIPRQYESFATPTPLFVRHSKTAEGEAREIRLTGPLFLPAEGAVKLTRNALPFLVTHGVLSATSSIGLPTIRPSGLFRIADNALASAKLGSHSDP